MTRFLYSWLLAATVLLAEGSSRLVLGQSAEPTIEGIWVAKIPGSKDMWLKPCGDGKRAWMWDEKNLYIVDAFGKQKKLFDGKKWNIAEVYPWTAGTEGEKWHAWVATAEPKELFRVSADGKECRRVELPAKGTIDKVHYASEKNGELWLSTREPARLFRVDENGGLHQYDELDDREIDRILPSGDSEKTAWALVIGDAGKSLYQLDDRKAHQVPNLTKILFLKNVIDFGTGKAHLWVVTEAPQKVDKTRRWSVTEAPLTDDKTSLLYRIDASNGKPVPCELKFEIGEVHPAGGQEGSAWVKSTDQRSLYLVDKAGRAQKTWQSTDPITAFVPLGDGKHALGLVEYDRRIYSITTDGAPELTPLGAADKIAWIKLIPGQYGECAWALTYWHELHELDGKKTVTSKPWLENVSDILVSPLDKNHVWVQCKAAFLHCVDRKSGVLTGKPIDSSSEPVFTAADASGGWIATHEIYAYGYTRDFLRSVKLTIGHTTFDLESRPGAVQDYPKNGTLNLQFSFAKPWEGKAIIKFEGANKEDVIVPKMNIYKDDLELIFDWPPARSAQDAQHDVVLSLTDELGTNLRIKWPSVDFVVSSPPWYRGPLALTFWAYLGIVAIGAAALLLLRPLPTISSWSPFSCWLLGLAAANLAHLDLWLHSNLLVALLGGTLPVALVLGLFSPATFRLLAKVQPFNLLSPVALRLGFVRRRLLAEYVAWLEWQLQQKRSAASNEVYVPLPTTMGAESASATLLVEPAPEICRRLTDPDLANRRNVLIESPGGRGKSALLRQVCQLAVSRFKDNPYSPLPVLCGLGKADNFESMIRAALGRHILSEDALTHQMLAGDFIVVIDGLSESEIAPDLLRQFIESENGRATCLLMSTRPDKGYREAVQSTPERTLLAEPQRLTDENLEAFQNAYLQQDRRQTNNIAAPLSDIVKAACRAADGTYLPLLVRWAVRVGGGEAGNVASIYQNTFQLLLQRRDTADRKLDDLQLLDDAAKLCVSTYWRNGFRRLAFEGAPPQRREIMQQLRNASILVPHDEATHADREHPRMLRFFHDSMQSYLTALGLFRGASEGDESIDGWGALRNAAGNPRFRDKSDLASEIGAELFQMCLHVFIPPEQLRDVFKNDFSEWIRKYERGLSKDDILRACAADLRQALEFQLDPGESAGIFLGKAIALCEQHDLDQEVHYLGILYGRIAPRIWALARADEATAAATGVFANRPQAPMANPSTPTETTTPAKV